MPDSPFYQNARQNFSSSQSMQQPQGFGGFGGGYQMPQQNFGGGQSFGGFGGGQGFNFGGGQAFGGFQQPQFSPFQGGSGGGFGGGFSPFQGGFGGGFQQPQFNPFQGGFGGGFKPMFGGIGGLGFNPMMGPQFGMPMQGFNPYQQQMQQFQQPQNFDSLEQPQQTFPSMDMMYRGGPQMSPEMQQRREQDMRSMERIAQNPFEEQQRQFKSELDALPEYQAIQNAQKALESSDAFKSLQQKQQKQQELQQMQARPMYGGIGGLGFNPMMGPQFGMPMQGFNPMMGQQFSSDHIGDMMSRGGPEMSRLSALQRGLARQQEGLIGTRDMPLTADQKYQQAQQFGNQAYLHRPEVRQANEDYSRRLQEAALAARG